MATGTPSSRSPVNRSRNTPRLRLSPSLVVARAQVGPFCGIASAALVEARERVRVLLLLEQHADEGNVRLELRARHAGPQQGADPVDQLGSGRLLPQLALLAEPVELDQHLIEQLGLRSEEHTSELQSL